MRTLGQIIEAAKSDERPSYEECYWAMLALASLSTFDQMEFVSMIGNPAFYCPQYTYNESYNRWHLALNKHPKEWLGLSNDPASEEYQKRRQMAFGILKKVSKD